MRATTLVLCLLAAGCASTQRSTPTTREQPLIQSVPSAPEPVLAPEPDLFVAVPHLVYGLNQMRSAQGQPMLRVDATLSGVAEHAARNVARLGYGAEQRVVDDVTHQLGRFELVFRRVAATALFTDRLEEALTTLSPGLDPAMRYAGVAIEPMRAYGPQFAVVVVVGE